MYRGDDAGAAQNNEPFHIEYETPEGRKSFSVTTSYGPYGEDKGWTRSVVKDWSYVLHMHDVPPELYDGLKKCVKETGAKNDAKKPLIISVSDSEVNTKPGNMHSYSIKSELVSEITGCLINTMNDLGYKIYQGDQLLDPAELIPTLEAKLEYARKHQPGAPRATPFTAR